MAVDTRDKRASILGVALAALVVLPAPDGTIANPERQHLSYSYAGLAADGPVAPPDVVSHGTSGLSGFSGVLSLPTWGGGY